MYPVFSFSSIYPFILLSEAFPEYLDCDVSCVYPFVFNARTVQPEGNDSIKDEQDEQDEQDHFSCSSCTC